MISARHLPDLRASALHMVLASLWTAGGSRLRCSTRRRARGKRVRMSFGRRLLRTSNTKIPRKDSWTFTRATHSFNICCAGVVRKWIRLWLKQRWREKSLQRLAASFQRKLARTKLDRDRALEKAKCRLVEVEDVRRLTASSEWKTCGGLPPRCACVSAIGAAAWRLYGPWTRRYLLRRRWCGADAPLSTATGKTKSSRSATG